MDARICLLLDSITVRALKSLVAYLTLRSIQRGDVCARCGELRVFAKHQKGQTFLMARTRGSKNRAILDREARDMIATARLDMLKHAPPLDFSKMPDSVAVMEEVMQYFFFRAKTEERALAHAAGKGRASDAVSRRVEEAFMRAAQAAEKVAPYRHAQLSAIKLADDINAKRYDHATLDELVARINGELCKLAPVLDLDAIRESQGVENCRRRRT